MNGDIGKLPSGAVYPATPDSLATASTSRDYSSLNGLADSLETYAQATSPPGGSPSDPNPGTDGGIPLDQLKQMLSSQLEYYFSRENLANDAYLISQMDNDQYVPIWTVANFNQVKKLTKDIKLITEVLRESPNVQVDEEGQKVRPNHKRCIVILREIPDNTPLEEVKALFSGEGCPRLISCEFAHNNSWYVTFESDEDAQRAYRFLREEVREFQGKPIMARIKAKPMNRLPLPPVPALGAAAMKNGYRTPPAAMYDPNAYQGQQRFLYTNGSSIPPNVNYGNQVHVYTFQQQPFYPPSMLQPWGPASPAYFDIGSVFSVNGLAPQGSFNKPQSSRYIPRNRSKRSQVGGGGDRGSMTEGTVSRQPTGTHSYHHLGASGGSLLPKTSGGMVGKTVQPMVIPDHNHSKTQHPPVTVATVIPQDAGDSSGPSQGTPGPPIRPDSEERYQRDVMAGKEPMPPRHRRRRKEDDVVVPGTRTPTVMGSGKPSTSGGSPQPLNRDSGGPSIRNTQFDLEATAFPPLPGLDAAVVAIPKATPPVEPAAPETSSSSHWENRLSDVVKGTAKSKNQSTSTKEKDGGGSASPRAVSPASPLPKLVQPPEVKAPSQQTSQAPSPAQLSPPPATEKESRVVGTSSEGASSCVALTPPASPDKTVPVAKCMADKSTKTDDIFVNGEVTVGAPGSGSKTSGEGNTKQPTSTVSLPSKQVPTTTNAATMTCAVVVTDVAPSRPAVATTSTATVMAGAAPAACPATEVCSGLETSGTARLSYAQVAQHHKEKVERMLREKQTLEQQEKEKERKKEVGNSVTRVTQQHSENREPLQREFREGSGRFMGRGGPRASFERERSERGGLRRREAPDRVPRFREFLRPRSPK